MQPIGVDGGGIGGEWPREIPNSLLYDYDRRFR